jgi:hypothetical protein
MNAFRSLCVIAMVVLASCATNAPSSPQWSKIEGCWFEDDADIWPAHVIWRRDPEHPGGYLGDWHREAAQGDEDRVSFTLAPVGDHMQLCDRGPGGPDRCVTAVFGRRGWHLDGVAVFDVRGTYHEFGYAAATTPFFWGSRRDCD